MRRNLFEDEHDWFRESVREFALRELTPHREAHRRDHGIPRSAWLAAGRAGLLGVSLPEELGGAGGDFRFNAVMGEELAAAGLAYASSFGIHTDVVAPYLLELTDAGQRERWLPRFVSGELVTAIGMTEPEAGSDLAALRTAAAREGDGWVLNGSKTFITNGAGADLVIVAARTGEARSAISLFAVEKGAPGFGQGEPLAKVGQPEADTAELFFEDVRLPAAALLGEVDRGFAYMMERLPQERLSAAFANLGHAAAALEVTLAYVKDRRAFGRPIGTFQNSRFALAEARTAIDVAFAFADRCLAEHVAGRLDPIDAAKAKWWSAEVQNQVIDTCVQMHGGYGYMDEYDVARAWTDARVTKIWAGSNEIMKEVIGRDLGLGEPR
ncbi:MAG TPA: acyl-CoA dehydrogenase family protein [Solirubrobacterales bacterium]|jgi:alkylation response protein AidB-like acyl-CoA dehydrogenase|nr:acyl-CoA dehydrogenase family protein [Solirubrobacterales bacterium]